MAPTPFRGSLPFPLTMRFPDGTERWPVRARANQEGLTCWDWDYTIHEPVIVYTAPLVYKTGDDAFAVDLGDDGIVTLTKGPGCGCSHPLKRWRPPGPSKA